MNRKLRSGLLFVLAGAFVVSAIQPALGVSDRDWEEHRRRLEEIRRINEQRKKELEQQRKELEKMSMEMLKEQMTKAKEAEKEERWAVAHAYYTDVSRSRIKGASKMASQSRKKMRELEDKAREVYREARAHDRVGKPVEAAKLYSQVVNLYGYADEAALSEARLRALRRDRKTGSRIAMAEAEVLEEAQDYVAAKKAYEAIVAEYPKEIVALKARKRLQEFEENEEISAAIKAAIEAEAAEHAPKMLDMAENFALNEHYAEARRGYREVIRKYPDTEYAEKAKAKLDELP